MGQHGKALQSYLHDVQQCSTHTPRITVISVVAKVRIRFATTR